MTAGIGQQSNRVRACGLNDLAAVFVAHGIFRDMNNNHTHECDEPVGFAADSGRPGRRDTPLVEAFLGTNFRQSAPRYTGGHNSNHEPRWGMRT